MRKITLAFVMAAACYQNSDAQSLMGRQPTQPQPAQPPAVAVNRPNPAARQRQVVSSAHALPEVEQPIITAIYRGPGVFDQHLFEAAIAAAAAYEANVSQGAVSAVYAAPATHDFRAVVPPSPIRPEVPEVAIKPIDMEKRNEDIHATAPVEHPKTLDKTPFVAPVIDGGRDDGSARAR